MNYRPWTIDKLMLSFPNCKINLGLNIVRKRSDGYHDLETVFYPVSILDALEMIRTNAETTIDTTGLTIESGSADNLCLKAYHLLKKHFHQLGNVHMHLHKLIPMGAGLGGGSADGAFALNMLNNLFNLDLTEQQLLQYALQLGSDCPFFIINKPCFATGRGEQLIPVELDLAAYDIIIINPGIHVSTVQAFANIVPAPSQYNIAEVVKMPVSQWKEMLVNDFEKNVFALYPVIAEIKQMLYDNGAIYASMSGSGSTVYGLFEKGKNVSLPISSSYRFYRV